MAYGGILSIHVSMLLEENGYVSIYMNLNYSNYLTSTSTYINIIYLIGGTLSTV